MPYWNMLTSMTGRTIHFHAERTVTEKPVPEMRRQRSQGQFKLRYFLPGKLLIQAATMGPCMSRPPAEGGPQPESPRLPLPGSQWTCLHKVPVPNLVSR